MANWVAFFLLLTAALGVHAQEDTVIYKTRGLQLKFRVLCQERISCAGVGDQAFWSLSGSSTSVSPTSTRYVENQFTRQHNGQQVISIELVFDPVLPEHHGAYTCHIGMNSVTSPEQFLIAVDTDPLEITSLNSNQDLSSFRIGQNFTIVCEVGTCYKDVSVNFLKGRDVLRVIKTAENIGRYTHTFAVDEDSAGVYGCKVDTPQGSTNPRIFTLTGKPQRE